MPSPTLFSSSRFFHRFSSHFLMFRLSPSWNSLRQSCESTNDHLETVRFSRNSHKLDSMRANTSPSLPDNDAHSPPGKIVPQKGNFSSVRGVVRRNLDIQRIKIEFHLSRLPRKVRTPPYVRELTLIISHVAGDYFVSRDFIGYLDRYIFLSRGVCHCTTLLPCTHVAICMRRTALCGR